jgi:hypothetical protein
MPRAKRICGKPNCPHAADGRYCTKHNAEYESERGTSTARGYGSLHQRTRARLNLEVQSGTVNCSRCGLVIAPNTPWHLDHSDEDRGTYLGPAHALCNTAAGGRKAHA